MAERILIGSPAEPLFDFDDEHIFETGAELAVGLVGQNLSIDSFTAQVSDDEDSLHDVLHFRSSDGREIQTAEGSIYCLAVGEATGVSPLVALEYGTPVRWFQDGRLLGKFFINAEVQRLGRNLYELPCVSAIGLLDEAEHSGGLFYATTFGIVLRHILAAGVFGTGDPVIDYKIDPDVEELAVSGWLPHDTKRNNIYQLIFAYGVNISKDVNGDPRFTFLYGGPEQPAPRIDPEEIYDEGKVSYDRPYKRVVLQEHSYSAVAEFDQAQVLFDNTAGAPADHAVVWFDAAPVVASSLETTGTLTVHSANENGAVVSGVGVLTGIPWIHSTRSVSMGDAAAPEEKTIRVEDSTMTNLSNSDNLLRRLFAFYCPADHIQKITNGIVWTDQRCGKVYEFPDPFDGAACAFLAKASVTGSTVNKAVCEWYADYAPAGQAGLYQHVIVLDKDTFAEDGGVFTLPEGITEIKVVMIGGGSGGGSGWPGKNGQDAVTYTEVTADADVSGIWYGAEGGDGGKGGSGGEPGLVKIVTIQNPESSYAYTIGNGGEGGTATGFIPDTREELRQALENEHPGTIYTDAELDAMIAQETALTDWDGSPHAGSPGTATTFGSWSTLDTEAYLPEGGVYDPIGDNYYALTGYQGIRGGKGGARQISAGGVFNWVTDGEDVTGEDGTVHHGGVTGRALTSVPGLPEAELIAYGGSGAGAAVGLSSTDTDPETGERLHPHMDGGSDQETSWEVTTDGV